ncbi:hypothetical protein CcaverHIS002_0404760 [Cutaneotrichosporon cavernicola]|uniref:Uncharacterized protein n=1 Tax=Cutaneotrichosporon cavernicola TaxID=279322 RepID=A0AA48QVS9_9TREE|nr:uncharacterized protein CcaverHIS019_0404730 [Cutaneotrichosporon cavernicola]BEI83872.1 hypothetical protein CcaverHIS002_0404760 [Cutaneotrichosporon cavernicola]BEI91653.1 hypothetical protein CcaverHIS019_0404730 [Cutaneotrichosporon cavernicola]BEI99428.1 hypothetical protein CcaverHIS631_0404710 [Cutaneotrichosporon cavernicola]BEJ07206.1 hypothetical protein CcaverHIS641_0404750 [Cutaneotrichosporon cavernicola]
MLALRRLLPATRSLHSSAIAWKGKAAAADEDVDMDDLFDDSVADLPSSGGGDRSARRAEFIGRIMNPTHGREEHRAGNLRKVVQLSDSPEQLEELGRVIQQWRVNGYGVSKQTSAEIVGRCINLGRADLADKYYRNRADYGLKHVSAHMATKLKTKLAEAKASQASEVSEASA